MMLHDQTLLNVLERIPTVDATGDNNSDLAAPVLSPEGYDNTEEAGKVDMDL